MTRWARKRPTRAHHGRAAKAEDQDGGSFVTVTDFDISPSDPLVAYVQSNSGAVRLSSLELDSPTVEALKGAGIELVIPLISHGDLVGLLNLGPHRSGREYSSDERKLLDDLVGYVGPAVRVAQLVRQQEEEMRTRGRLEQELRVAQLIQQQFLPKELPHLPGWDIAAFYRPAQAVGGDFYDFIELPDGKMGVVVGDVTDKGVPAALVMATTHSILRSDAPRLVTPSAVLERANDLLVSDIPAHMFVTCLYGVLDPANGTLTFANAGHNLPYLNTGDEAVEIRATGMPLGLMAGSRYEEREASVAPGQSLLLHSDGIAEAHNDDREMFGFPRLRSIVAGGLEGNELIDDILSELDQFTGAEWEQEDDITLVSLCRGAGGSAGFGSPPGEIEKSAPDGSHGQLPRDAVVLADFELESLPGNERAAMERVVEAVRELDLPSRQLDRIKTAVSEATMNAIEHGNENRPHLPVRVSVLSISDNELLVRVTDSGGDRPIPEAETPDIDAKLAGEQSPRGWGLFLIRNMVDDMRLSSEGTHHTIELAFNLRKGHGDEHRI
nr:SpoIIE family protein phosphatase [Actinomycetota bacterium]